MRDVSCRCVDSLCIPGRLGAGISGNFSVCQFGYILRKVFSEKFPAMRWRSSLTVCVFCPLSFMALLLSTEDRLKLNQAKRHKSIQPRDSNGRNGPLTFQH